MSLAAVWFKDQIRIDLLTGDADVDGAKTWTAGVVVLAKVDDKATVLRLPDGTEVKSSLAVMTHARCPEGARVFVAPLPSSGEGPRRFPASYAFADKQWRVPLVVRSSSSPGMPRVFELYF